MTKREDGVGTKPGGETSVSHAGEPGLNSGSSFLRMLTLGGGNDGSSSGVPCSPCGRPGLRPQLAPGFGLVQSRMLWASGE